MLSEIKFFSSRYLPVKFAWPMFKGMVDGWIPKFALFVPLIGYLIIFNDQILAQLTFNDLAGDRARHLLIDSDTRLRLLYFGFFFLGISNFIYRIFVPEVVRHGKSLQEYKAMAINSFDFSSFEIIYLNLGRKIQSGKIRYPTLDMVNGSWRKFEADMSKMGGGVATTVNTGTTTFTRPKATWEELIQTHGDFIRSLLKAHFITESCSRQWVLAVCVVLSLSGYVMLSIPSANLFLQVLASTFK